MQHIKHIVDKYFIWILLLAVVVGFFILAGQGGESQQEKDSDFVNASAKNNMFRGESSAPVDVVIYTDFLCPYCTQLANEVMPKIEEEFVTTGKAKVEVRPVAMIGLDSTDAAAGAYCAADQDKFWAYHDTLYEYVAREVNAKNVDTRNEHALPKSVLKRQLQQEKGFDKSSYDACIDNETHADTVAEASSDATTHGVSGTPHVMVNGNHVQGLSYEILSSVIKAQLE